MERVAGLSITTGLLTIASLAAVIAANTWNPGSQPKARIVVVPLFWLFAAGFGILTAVRLFTGNL